MNILQRAIGICTQPAAEWRAIAAEPTPGSHVLVRYVLPLAIADAVAGLVAWAVLTGTVQGEGGVTGGYRLFWSAFGLVTILVACTVAAIVVNGFASSFRGTADRRQALKLAGYSATPILLLNLVRGFLPIRIGAAIGFAGAVYAVYVLYTGLPILMKSPEDRSLPYALVVAAGVFAIMWVLMTALGVLVIVGSLFTDTPFRIV